MNKKIYVYKTVENHEILLDVYSSDNNNSPVILYLHGGALIWGSRLNMNPKQIDFYHNLGFTVISIDYRLAPYTKLLNIIDDVKDAYNFVCKNSEMLNINKNKIVMLGSSAGAYLALLSGTFENKPKAIISFYGYGDIISDWNAKPSEHYCKSPLVHKEDAYKVIDNKITTVGSRERFTYYLYTRQKGIWTSEVSGFHTTKEKQQLIKACPRYMAKKGYPITLLIHGDQDTDVPHFQSVLMSDKLTQLNVLHKLMIIEGKDHAFDYDMDDIEVKKIFNEIRDFLIQVIIKGK